ncbi:Histone-lysine N-methyltransferase SETMAR, partial [Habropoda laboriosa]
GSILLHDNARPHVTSTTVQKLHQLGTEILLRPVYSPDLSSVAAQKRFRKLEDIENAF